MTTMKGPSRRGSRPRAACAAAFSLSLVLGGCMMSAGPVIGFRQRHLTLGWNVAPQLAVVRVDVGQSFRIGGQAPARAVTYAAGGVMVGGRFGLPVSGVMLASLGGWRGGGDRGWVFALGGGVGEPLTSGSHGPCGAVVGALLVGVRFLGTTPELWVSPQLGCAYFPEVAK